MLIGGAIFIFGCLIVALIYTLMYVWLYQTFPSIYAEIGDGKAVVTGTLAVVLIVLAWKLPWRIKPSGLRSKD